MKKTLLLLTLFTGSVLLAGTTVTQKMVADTSLKVVKHACVLETSLGSVQLTQKLIKDYHYRGMGLDSRALDIEVGEFIVGLNRFMQEFDSYVSEDKKVQQNLKMIQIAEKEFEGIMVEHYSPGNAQLLMDLASVISESTTGILDAVHEGAEIYKKDSKTRMLRLSSL